MSDDADADEMKAMEEIAGVALAVGNPVGPSTYAFEITRMMVRGLSNSAAGWLAAHVLLTANCCDQCLAEARAAMDAKLAKDRKAIEARIEQHKKDVSETTARLSGAKPPARH